VSRIDLRRGALHVGCWLDVAPTLEAGCAALAIVDGPYNMRKAEWDCFASWDAFRDWYEPQVVALGRVLAASATVYLWGSDESAGELRPLMRRLGWEYLGRVTWDKVSPPVLKSAPEDLRRWPDVTEVADVWGREAWTGPSSAGAAIGYAAGADERNWIRTWLCEEWISAGLRLRQADEALGTNGMAGHYFQASQWSLPTWDAYARLAAVAAEHGPPRERPYFVHPAVLGGASHDHLRAEYDHLRAEYEAIRRPFSLPAGVTNIWDAPTPGGRERLLINGEAHPCQKPLAFYDRMIRASSRPGDLVVEPFGGTCRAAVACERLLASEMRRYVCVEADARYVEAVLPQLRTAPETTATVLQPSLFRAREVAHGS